MLLVDKVEFVLGYLVQRVLLGLLVLLGVSVTVFGLTYLGGDPAAALLPLNTAPEDVELFRHKAGLDQPLPIQYINFLSHAVQGDFGNSFRYREGALGLILERLPATLTLAGVGMFFALLIAIPFGIISGLNRGTMADTLSRMLVLLGQSVPGFWLAIVLILIFAVKLRWLPVSGAASWQSLILPGFVVAAFPAAIIARLLRSSLINVMNKEYIRTARAKGLAPAPVLFRHALKNAAIPVVTVIGLQIGTLLGGAVIAEVVFAYPGVGRLMVQSISARDLPVIQAFVAVTATIVVTVNLVLDLIYTWLDPRITF
ncbi:MAG TPA: ABC transporter permease [Anaerolineae bacterium]|nr:ABC transporter permease [Anaerolineae bacterium]